MNNSLTGEAYGQEIIATEKTAFGTWYSLYQFDARGEPENRMVFMFISTTGDTSIIDEIAKLAGMKVRHTC